MTVTPLQIVGLIALVLIAATVITGIIAAKRLIPLPFFSYSQGDQVHEGKISEIKEIAPGVFEAGIQQVIDVDPTLETDIIQNISCGVTRFIYFRKIKNLPKVGQLIEVDTTNRNQRFTGNSYNWVNSWSVRETVASGGTLRRTIVSS
jgi:hypothetical protein